MAIIEYSLDLADLGAKRARERRVAFLYFFKVRLDPFTFAICRKKPFILTGNKVK